MADYVLSNRADSDLNDIYEYSYRTFGEARADAYFLSLRDCLQALAENPLMGRYAGNLLAGLRCHDQGRHSIYYLVEDDGIFVVRILHDAMDASLHLNSVDDAEPLR